MGGIGLAPTPQLFGDYVGHDTIGHDHFVPDTYSSHIWAHIVQVFEQHRDGLPKVIVSLKTQGKHPQTPATTELQRQRGSELPSPYFTTEVIAA